MLFSIRYEAMPQRIEALVQADSKEEAVKRYEEAINADGELVPEIREGRLVEEIQFFGQVAFEVVPND